MNKVSIAKGSALVLVLSLVVAGDATAAPLSKEAPTRLELRDDAQQLARRRSRQKSQKGKSRRSQKQAEAAQPEPGEQAPAAQQAGVDAATRRGPTRVEFDERLLQGQTNKANAIYLFQRRESALRSLVKKREHFHEEIDEALE